MGCRSVKTILIGIDSGGTRTNVLIRKGDERHSYELTEALSGSLVPSEYSRTLRHILAPAENYLRFSEAGTAVSVFISAAGFAPSVREDFLEALNDVVPQMLDGRISVIGIANDAPTLLFGHAADGIVIAGTGSSVLVRSKDGQLYQVGGHEWVASDYGAGFWIGLRAIRRAYRDHEENVRSVLLQRLIHEYGVRPDDSRRLIAKLRDLAIADENMKPEISRFAAEVCSAAERGDGPAQDIVKSEAEDLADVVAGALRRRFTHDEMGDGVNLVQCGGLLSNEFYRHAFESQVEMRLRSGSDHPATISWRHVTTGTEAALNMASDLASAHQDLAAVDNAFRPLVVRFN